MLFISDVIAFYFKFLSAGKERDNESSSEWPDANSSQKLQDVNVSAEMMVASVSIGETVKMDSLEDAPANPSDTKEKSDPGSSALQKI